eukprot:3885966-Rhodomonas_salina.1
MLLFSGQDGMLQSVCGGNPQGGPRRHCVPIAGRNACSAIVSLSLLLVTVTGNMTVFQFARQLDTRTDVQARQTHRHTDRDTQRHTATQTQADSSDTQALHHQDRLLHCAAVRAHCLRRLH